jgi:hypothetical protein
MGEVAGVDDGAADWLIDELGGSLSVSSVASGLLGFLLKDLMAAMRLQSTLQGCR